MEGCASVLLIPDDRDAVSRSLRRAGLPSGGGLREASTELYVQAFFSTDFSPRGHAADYCLHTVTQPWPPRSPVPSTPSRIALETQQRYLCSSLLRAVPGAVETQPRGTNREGG